MPTGPKSTPNALNEALSTVIKMKMEHRQFNISDLAGEADMPRPTLSRILSNHKDPDLGQIQRIAKALNMPVSKLLDVAEKMRDGKDPI